MFKKCLLLLLGILIVPGVCFAQEESAVESMEDTTAVVAEESALVLEEVAICKAVEDRQPTGIGTIFTNDLDKIYCFTKIVGATDTISVNHVWYMGDQQVASVNLPIKSATWRTWSSKMIGTYLGKGHVEIVSENGTVLGKADFEITAAEESTETSEEEETKEPEAEESEEPEEEESEETAAEEE